MTHPDQTIPQRHAAELRAALKGSEDLWFSMSEDSFVAAGRLDGAATVVVSSRGREVVYHVDEKPQIDTYPTAVEAVAAARARTRGADGQLLAEADTS